MRLTVQRLLLVLLALVASAANAEKRMAILSDDKTASLSDLLTASLSGMKDIALVERKKLSMIVSEQALSAAMATVNVAERVKLGQILQADLLLLLSVDHAGASRRVRFAVAETQFGLRLYSGLFEDVDLTAQVEHIHSKVATVVARSKHPTTHIVAVAPFLNNSFTHDKDYLQEAYAALVNHRILDCPGFAVVEIAEAQAIGRERELMCKTSLKRPEPCYLVGQYEVKNNGNADVMSLQMDLRIGKQLTKVFRHERIKLLEVPMVLDNWVDKALKLVAAEAAPPNRSSSLDRDLLLFRAREFISIGHCSQALPILEAVLLLDPTSQSVRVDAMRACLRSVSMFYTNDPKADEAQLRDGGMKALRLFSRAIEHEEYALRRANNFREMLPRETYVYWELLTQFSANHLYDRNTRKTARDVIAQRRDMLVKLVEHNRTMSYNDLSLQFTAFHRMLGHAGDDSQNEFQARLRMATLMLKHFPKRGRSFIRSLAPTSADRSLAGYDAYADAYALLTKELGMSTGKTHSTAKAQKRASNGAADPQECRFSDTMDVAFHRIQLSVEEDNGRRIPLRPKYWGLLPLRENRDLFWTERAIYTMQDSERMQKLYVFDPILRSINPCLICYDGKYVWFITGSHDKPTLNVIDPGAPETVVSTRPGDLLPQRWHFKVVPVGVGRVFMLGTSGKSGSGYRTWFAFAELKEGTHIDMRVINEARRQPEGKRLNDRNTAILPEFCFVSPRSDKKRKVVISPSTTTLGASQVIISVDCRTQQSLVERHSLERIANNYDYARTESGIHWFLGKNIFTIPWNQPSTVKTQPIAFATQQRAPTSGQVLFWRGRVFIITLRHVYVAPSVQQPFLRLRNCLPGDLGSVLKSNVHGLVFKSVDRRMFRFEFTEPLDADGRASEAEDNKSIQATPDE